MSSGEAKALHKRHKQPVQIVGRDGRPIISDIFAGVAYIVAKPQGRFQRLVNGPGVRPYIKEKTEAKWTWRKYEPTPADVIFSYDELKFAEPYRGMVMVEPVVKNIGHENKAWPLTYWQHLDTAIHIQRIAKVVQCGPQNTRRLLYATTAVTPSFRHAMAVLSVCRAYVGPEGGLHHAAAAVGTPAVVIFGGFISPDVTGYTQHRNLFKGTGLGCGMRTNCKHCRDAMFATEPSEVLKNLKEILDAEDRRLVVSERGDASPSVDGEPEGPHDYQRPVVVPGQEATGLDRAV